MNNILVVGAHFDDSELGAGGSMAKWSSEGKTVYKMTLTDNKTDFKALNIKVDFDSSKTQSSRACDILGVHEIVDFPVQDCNFLQYSTGFMQTIESIIEKYEIDTMIMHFKEDMNQDHVAASKLCLTAARHCDTILSYQGNGYILQDAYYPQYFVDISRFVELKKKALSMYGTEHNRYGKLFDTCLQRNAIWGYANLVDYAEGFHVIKMLQR